MGTTRRRLLASIVLAAVPVAVGAQFEQYTPAGGPEPIVTDPKEELEQAVADSRWRLGGLRVDPWFGVRNVGFVDQGTGDDQLTGSAGVGLRAYLPTGPKVIWAAHALPEYTWYEESSDRSRLNGRYGLGFFGFFNRLTVQAQATLQEQLDVISAEIQQRVNARNETLSLLAELRLAASVNLFGSFSTSTITNLLEDEERFDPTIAPFDLLDRDEEVARVGVRYRSRGDWLIGLGVEETDTQFDDAAFDRSNSGTSPYLELTIPARSLLISLDLVQRDLEPDPGSDFVPYDDLTGSLALTFGSARSRLSPTLYAHRELVYTLDASSYLVDERFGVRTGFPLGRRMAIRLFAETGTHDYAQPPFGPARSDDVTAFGADVDIPLGRGARFNLGYSIEEFESNPPGFDRTVDIVRAGVTFSASRGLWY
ncbi:MAG TPA: hypothetical protein VMV46_03915 [Thermoanaerobaculia bacterium]|nr:hypothetical protein [Thermoanaerobaculia bacterium]